MKQINDKVFIDTNILIYAYSLDEPVKRKLIEQLLNQYAMVVISTQVLNEFVNVMTKKKKLTYNQLIKVIRELESVFRVELVDVKVINNALLIAEKYSYSYFDSLIISSALSSECSILYTEDLHHQQMIEKKLSIQNPFKSTE